MYRFQATYSLPITALQNGPSKEEDKEQRLPDVTRGVHLDEYFRHLSQYPENGDYG